MIVEMRIASLLIDPSTGLPIVVLVETGAKRAVPIVIGMAEAEAIAVALQRTALPRPRTHDLMRSLLGALGGTLDRIVIHDLRDSTFFALLHIRQNGRTLEVDSRPSDAMALACRTGSAIYMSEEVLERARMRTPEEGETREALGGGDEEAEGGVPEETEGTVGAGFVPIAIDANASVEELQEILENLRPEDFGKYKM
jgi:uncharacterized protein